MFKAFKKFNFRALVITLIAAQLALAANFVMFPPKKAEAIFGIGDVNFSFGTEVISWYDVFKQIALGAAERVAISYANKYITKVTDKINDKYRIKDYLNYDKVLSGYYLNKYVYDNVDDPDLRAIYGLLARNVKVTTTDPVTGKQKPLLAVLKEKIDKYYYGQGGINSNKIYNPGANVTDQEYFASARAYFANPPIFTEMEVYAEYGRLAATSNSAAATEIANSNGLKNDRSPQSGSPVSYECSDFYVEEGPQLPGTPPAADPRSSQAACEASGGNWEVDATGMLQSAIQNPSSFIKDFATSGIQQVFANNLGLNKNIFSTVGQFLGSFIFNKLNLDKPSATTGFSGVLNDGTGSYSADAGNLPPLMSVDVDGDNIPDGDDQDSDGRLATTGETCFHGGTAPNCRGSSSAVTSPYFTPICQSIDRAVVALTEYATFIDKFANQIEGGSSLAGQIIGGIMLGGVGVIFARVLPFGGSADNFKNKADADVWGRRTGEVATAVDGITNSIQSYHSSYFDTLEFAVGRYSVYMADVIKSLQKDKDLDLARFGSGGGGLQSLMKNTGYILRYLTEVKAQIGKCENPNLRAVGGIVAPPELVDTEAAPPGPTEGACVEFISLGSAVFQGQMANAVNRAVVRAEESGLADLPATRGGNLEAFRDLVIEEVSNGGDEGSTAYNGNCNISVNQVAIRTAGSATGEAYDIVRDDPEKTIGESARVNYVGDASWTFFVNRD